MNNEWLTYVKNVTNTSGHIEAGSDLILEWRKGDILAPELADFKKSICDFASEELAPAELEFLRMHPDAVSQEIFLRPCESLLETADWEAIEEKIKATIKQFYLTDLSSFGPEIIKPLMDDIYFFATLKRENQLMGFIMFAVTPALPHGNIKVINLLACERGLEKILLSCIFTLVPKTKKIFLFVRPTNKKALQLYHEMGFVHDLESFQDPNHKVNTKYLIPLEYKKETTTKMRYQFYREHKYVSAALNDVERLIARMDFCDANALSYVAKAFEELSQMLQGHAQYENERLHVLLDKKGSKVHIHAADEHAHQEKQLSEIQELISKITQASVDDEKILLGYQLYLAYRKFVADNLIHLHEEETQILPELQRLYSDSELQLVEANTYREMTSDEMVGMIQVLFPHMNTYDRWAVLFDILSLEPRKFEIVWKDIQSLVTENERIAIELEQDKYKMRAIEPSC